MIAELADQLVTLIKTVPALSQNTALVLGGTRANTTFASISLPAAWVQFRGDNPEEQPYTTTGHGGGGIPPGISLLRAYFTVAIFVPYLSDSDLIQTQYPLFESVIKAVRGQRSASRHIWMYMGQKFGPLGTGTSTTPDKAASELTFMVNFNI